MQGKAAQSETLASNTVRWVIGPDGTTVIFSEDIGLTTAVQFSAMQVLLQIYLSSASHTFHNLYAFVVVFWWDSWFSFP